MKIRLPDDVKTIIHALQESGHEAYAVGGCVRDSVLGITPSDWDVTTSARPKDVKKIFAYTVDTGIEHGTVTVLMHHVGYEVTTYRIDGEYTDSRHPKDVIFTTNLLEDLKRRDFTINAMAYNEDVGLVDAFGGMDDLQKKIIRCVGDPMERFSEDALRMMRGIRFAAQLDFSLEEDTYRAIRQLAPTLQKISAERIQIELVKLLVSNHPEKIRDMYETGLTKIFLPEFDVMMETPQNNINHCYSVGVHTIEALKKVENTKNARLGILLHDIAKPVVKTTDEDGVDHFKGHQTEGEKMAKEILRRLKFDNESIRIVSSLVRFHDERPQLTEKSVRKAIVRMNSLAFPVIFSVKMADILSQSEYRREEKIHEVEEFHRLYDEIIRKKQCLAVKDLEIDGTDILALGIQRGPRVGEILHALLEEVLEDPLANERNHLLARAKDLCNME